MRRLFYLGAAVLAGGGAVAAGVLLALDSAGGLGGASQAATPRSERTASEQRRVDMRER